MPTPTRRKRQEKKKKFHIVNWGTLRPCSTWYGDMPDPSSPADQGILIAWGIAGLNVLSSQNVTLRYP
ncbi:unnamed protein product [Fusarium graminearum]|nr:unnamed protein product [Fusarium graminearum]